MWQLLKRFFGFFPKEKQIKNEEFENVQNFLNKSSDVNVETVTDSKSTLFFKKASDILDSEENIQNNEEITALQSFILSNDEVHEEEIIEEKPEDILVNS